MHLHPANDAYIMHTSKSIVDSTPSGANFIHIYARRFPA